MKEEEGGCSSQKRRAEWESLQPELVHLIADCVLSSSGVDEYMAMRAVCPSWRSAISKPSPHAAVADLRFRPRRWVMLEAGTRDEGPLFLNVTTGRFRRLRLPVLRDYIFVGVSDGLLVLGASERPHAARLLNPLTGDMLPFATPIPPEALVVCAISGSEPTIIFSFPPHYGEYKEIPAYCSLDQGGHAVYSADPTGELRVLKFHDAACNGEGLFYLQSMVTCAGNVYMLSAEGILYKIVWTSGHWYAEQIMEVYLGNNGVLVLVESAGKLLLVKDQPKTIGVFNVDVKRKVLEPIESIGSSALFLSPSKCMVVDADMLPSIKRSCIYSTYFIVYTIDGIYALCDLGDGKRKIITVPQEPGDFPGAESGIIHERPLSLAQALLAPYPEVKAQLDHIHQT